MTTTENQSDRITRETIHQMLIDWNAATPEQRQSAMDAAAKLAENAKRNDPFACIPNADDGWNEKF